MNTKKLLLLLLLLLLLSLAIIVMFIEQQNNTRKDVEADEFSQLMSNVTSASFVNSSIIKYAGVRIRRLIQDLPFDTIPPRRPYQHLRSVHTRSRF